MLITGQPAPLSTHSQPPSAENRSVTILFIQNMSTKRIRTYLYYLYLCSSLNISESIYVPASENRSMTILFIQNMQTNRIHTLLDRPRFM